MGVACHIAQALGEAAVAVAVVPAPFEAMQEGSAADLRALPVLSNPAHLLMQEVRSRTNWLAQAGDLLVLGTAVAAVARLEGAGNKTQDL